MADKAFGAYDEKITPVALGDEVLIQDSEDSNIIKRMKSENFVGPQGPIGPDGVGDMESAVYDPQNIADDAFDQDNMTDGIVNKNYTAIEKSKLNGIEAGATADQTSAEIKVLYEANTNTNAYTDSEKAEVATISEKQQAFTSVPITADVTLAVAYNSYLVDATAGDVIITLPDVVGGNFDEFRVTLVKDTHNVQITTTGGAQEIGEYGMTTINNQTVGGSLFLKANGVDGYDIVGDSREYYRVITLDGAGTTNLSVSGYESIAIYHCEGMIEGETRTIVIPDDPSNVEGFAFKALLDGEGTVIVKTLLGLEINGQTEIDITNDGGGVEICSFGDHYGIIQDSRPKVQNVGLTFYSLSEDSIIADPGVPSFYKQSSNSIDDARFDQITPTITPYIISGLAQYLGGVIGDEGVIGGVLPEGPVTSVLVGTRTAGLGTATYYVEYYKWETDLTETLLGTSTDSTEVNSASITEYTVTATLPETTFAPTDRLLRKVYMNRTGGASDPTINFYAEGPNPSFSRVAIGASSITHNSLGGLQIAAPGVTYGHIDDQAQSIAGIKTFSSSPLVPTPTTDFQAATKKYVDDNAGGGGGAVSVLNTFTQSGTIVTGTYGTWNAGQAGTMTEFNAAYLIAPTGTSATVEIFKNDVSMGTITIVAGQGTQSTLTGGAYVKFDKFNYVVTEGGTIAGGSITINAITS